MDIYNCLFRDFRQKIVRHPTNQSLLGGVKVFTNFINKHYIVGTKRYLVDKRTIADWLDRSLK